MAILEELEVVLDFGLLQDSVQWDACPDGLSSRDMLKPFEEALVIRLMLQMQWGYYSVLSLYCQTPFITIGMDEFYMLNHVHQATGDFVQPHVSALQICCASQRAMCIMWEMHFWLAEERRWEPIMRLLRLFISRRCSGHTKRGVTHVTSLIEVFEAERRTSQGLTSVVALLLLTEIVPRK